MVCIDWRYSDLVNKSTLFCLELLQAESPICAYCFVSEITAIVEPNKVLLTIKNFFYFS